MYTSSQLKLLQKIFVILDTSCLWRRVKMKKLFLLRNVALPKLVEIIRTRRNSLQLLLLL